MKKLLFALGCCSLLVLLLLPSASAHKPAGQKKEDSGEAAPGGAPAPQPRPATPRLPHSPARAARPGEARPKRHGRQYDTAPRAAQSPAAGQARSGEARPQSGELVFPDEFDGDVRDLPQVPSTPKIEFESAPPASSRKVPPGQAATEAVSNIGLAAMPAPVQNFAGLSFSSTVTGGRAGAGLPPDINGEVGLNHYVQGVNDSWAIYNKTGTLLASFTENSLWANAGFGTPCNGNNQGDPVVIYDQFADRWILTNFAFAFSGGEPVAPFYQCFAVSKTSDPVAGGWWLYAFRMDLGGTNSPPVGALNDYPKFGNWNDGCLYMSANEFAHPGGTYIGSLFASFNKSDMEGGAAASAAVGFISNGPFTMIPSNISGARDAASLPPPGTPNYFVAQSDTLFAYEVLRFTPGARCGATGASLGAPFNVSQSSYFPPNDSAGSPNIVPQPSTTNLLDSLGDRLMQKVQYRRVGSAESLWVTHTVRTASAAGNTGQQWAQINVSGGSISATPVQQQIYKPDTSTYRWMGSIAADHVGNVALGYSTSSTASFPGIAYSGRLVTDPLNNLSQTETQLIAGAGSQTLSDFDGFVHRWGDYTAMSVDPADDCTFWYTNQYYSSPANGNTGNWQTRVGSFKFPTCTSPTACNYSISPADNSVGAGATTGSVTVTTTAGCAWTAVSNSAFLTITAGSSGTGGGTVSYSVAANTTNTSRTGTLTVAGQTFTVTQAAGTCPTTTISFGQTLSGALATTDCRATFRSGSYADRYTFSGTAGQQVAVSMSSTQFDTYLFLLAPNGTTAAFDDDGGGGITTNSRIPATSGFLSLPATGTYTIEATSFTADAIGSYTVALTTQTPCTYAISPTALNFNSGGGSASVAVTAGSGCAWAAASNSSFITITAGSSGTGNGTVSYSVAANPNTSARSGTMTIAGQTFTVTQDAAPCTYSIAPTAQSFTSAAGTGSVAVTAPAGCAWTATSNNPSFITITAGASGSGSGTVSYSVTANTTNSSRTGTLTVAGQTFTVTQAAASGGGCTTTPISVGQTVNGALSTTDCLAGDGSFYDAYTFAGTSGQQVAIAMSAGFDTYLLLLSPDGSVLAQDDDGGGGTNSRIPATSGFITLPAGGTYTIIANSFAASVTGPYTLTLTGTTPQSALQFSSAGYSFDEGGNSAAITVTRSGDTSGSATVAFATVDDPAAVPCSTINGTAYARCDYATTLDTLTFAPGVTSRTINIPLINDVYVEGAETVQLRLTNPTGAALGAQATATLTITDNDAGPAANPVFSSPFFVRMQYLDFLSREPDAGGFNAYLNLLNGCPDVNNVDPNAPSAACDRITVSAAFFGSQEFQLKGFFVFRFYRAAFNRLPVYTEIVADMRNVTGTTAQEVFTKKAAFTAAFTQRQEFANAYGAMTSAQYVAALLGRYGLAQIICPDPAQPDGTTKVTLTNADLVNRLNAGTLTRAQVLRAVADSDQVAAAEFNRAFVGMQYYGYLRRTPDAPGFNAWLNYLTAHPDDFRTMVNGFMNSQEYRLRFGQP